MTDGFGGGNGVADGGDSDSRDESDGKVEDDEFNRSVVGGADGVEKLAGLLLTPDGPVVGAGAVLWAEVEDGGEGIDVVDGTVEARALGVGEDVGARVGAFDGDFDGDFEGAGEGRGLGRRVGSDVVGGCVVTQVYLVG